MINGGIIGGYYGKGGGATGGGISQAALNTAINTLKTALEAEIAKKADDAGTATDAEVASAISDLQSQLDAKADETSVVSRLRAKANTATVTALGRTLRSERAGVLLNETAQQTVANLNTARTDTQVIDDIGFSVLPIFRDELDDYDRFLMEVSELAVMEARSLIAHRSRLRSQSGIVSKKYPSLQVPRSSRHIPTTTAPYAGHGTITHLPTSRFGPVPGKRIESEPPLSNYQTISVAAPVFCISVSLWRIRKRASHNGC